MAQQLPDLDFDSMPFLPCSRLAMLLIFNGIALLRISSVTVHGACLMHMVRRACLLLSKSQLLVQRLNLLVALLKLKLSEWVGPRSP